MVLLPFVWAYALQFTDAREARLAAATAVLESDRDPRVTECELAPPPHRHFDDPSYATPAHPCRCGLYQTDAASRAECVAQRDPLTERDAWREQREAWRAQCSVDALRYRVRLDARSLETCTIAGYAVGGAGERAALGLDARPGKTALWGLSYARRLMRAAGG